MIESITQGVGLITGYTLLYMAIGILLGIGLGMIPGMGTSLGMAIVLPLTIVLEPIDAIILLIAIYSGGMYGGSIAAILINTPGTSAAAATTLDGYPMSQQGKALTALTMSAISSAVGGAIGIAILVLISPVITYIVLQFGSPEYFLVAFLGLAMIPVVTKGPLVKGIISGMFGLLITTVGLSTQTGEARYTFGQLSLFDGISFIAVLIGLFAISEMIHLASKEGGIASESVELTGGLRKGVQEVLKYPKSLLKGSLIGISIGAIPGAGSSVSTFVAYGEALRSSANPDLFGNGASEGVISVESCNNSTVAGSLIPTLSFGIPGSGSTAVLLGGLLMHGLQPGPQLFGSDLYITYSMLFTLLLGNILILFVGLTMIRKIGRITQVDTDLIIPIVIVMSIVGAFILRANWIDVMTVAGLGVLGYYMKQHDYNIIALVLGSVLGGTVETNLFRSLQISGDSYLIFVTRPISLVLVILIVMILFGPYLKNRISGA